MIRLRALQISDLRNVEQGRVVLSSVLSLDDVGDGAEVVGLYGQNGSGKTSFIEALSILKSLMCGEEIQQAASEFVRSGQSAMTIRAEFFVAAGDDDLISDYITGEAEFAPPHVPYLAVYEVRIGSHMGKSPLILSESLSCKQLTSGESMHEIFSWSVAEGAAEESTQSGEENGLGQVDQAPLIPQWMKSVDSHWMYDLGDIMPVTRWQSLLASNKPLRSKLEATRHQAFQQGTSLLFSSGFTSFLREYVSEGGRKLSRAAQGALLRVCVPTFQIVASCRFFATKDMVVLPTTHQGVLPLGYLPLASHEGARGEYVDNFMLLDIEKPNPVAAQHVDELERALANISEVIGELVPGLRIEVDRLGAIAGNDGETLQSIELMSVRDRTRVPLRYESEGIKKVLSIVSLLIDVHTNPTTFVAIDELDSGIFEFLLGEILQTIGSHGCGQLVFTAHNLRPLEVLKSSSIWFTTVRPEKRYARATGVRGTNNLRSMYLRDIRLGSDEDDIYVPTSPLRIDSALFDAGAVVKKMRRASRS